jgi:hypothetical protein
MKKRMLKAMNDPHTMEILYRENPSQFEEVFEILLKENPDHLLFRVWKERLEPTSSVQSSVEKQLDVFAIEFPAEDDPYRDGNAIKQSFWKTMMPILFICMLIALGGFFAKLPDFFPSCFPWNKDPDAMYYMRNITAFFLPGLAILYIILRKNISPKVVWITLGMIAISLAYINLLPNYVFPGKIDPISDTLILACLHVPFLYWFAGGFAWTNGEYKNLQKRIQFIQLNGEVLITTVLILLAGLFLSVLSMTLFEVINVDVGGIIWEWVAVFGAIGCPIVAVFLVLKRNVKNNLLAILVRGFTPLFTIVVIVFLALILLRIRNPFEDREYLITINFLLFVIVTLSTYVIVYRDAIVKNFVNVVLSIFLGGGFLIGIISLAAVLLRLFQDGFTPNRIALIGMNILLTVNIGGLLYHELKWLFKKAKQPNSTVWIATYLPIYLLWSLFMVFLYPWIFGLR